MTRACKVSRTKVAIINEYNFHRAMYWMFWRAKLCGMLVLIIFMAQVTELVITSAFTKVQWEFRGEFTQTIRYKSCYSV